ncbi:MAG: esterase, partial [Cellulophaga sp.]|nr:esterase [Cellulophaga sp.]
LIENKIIEPLIYVGSHSNSKAIKNNKIKTHDGLHIKIQYRNFEYVENMDIGNDFPELSERFKNHMLYFTEELILGIEKELKLSFLATDRIFYGVSNGAGFGANLLNKFPDVIGTYICYSTIGSNVENNLWKEDIKYPVLYLQYGNEEDFIFKQEAEKLKMKYNKSNSFCELRSFIGGHDYKKWDEEFTKTIIKISNSEIE